MFPHTDRLKGHQHVLVATSRVVDAVSEKEDRHFALCDPRLLARLIPRYLRAIANSPGERAGYYPEPRLWAQSPRANRASY
jgi:hypothetical protein